MAAASWPRRRRDQALILQAGLRTGYHAGRDARDPDPSWADVWDSAAALAAHVRADPAAVAGKRVVDLGCGLGVVGLNAALAGAASVALVDREPEALHCAMVAAARMALDIFSAAASPRRLAGRFCGHGVAAASHGRSASLPRRRRDFQRRPVSKR